MPKGPCLVASSWFAANRRQAWDAVQIGRYADVFAAVCRSLSPSGARFLFGFAEPPDALPRPPVVPVKPSIRRYDELEWRDDYHWLEDGGQAVQQVLQRERQYADAWLKRCASLASTLHDEMLQLVPTAQTTEAEHVDGYDYFVEHAPLPRYMRRRRDSRRSRTGACAAPGKADADCEVVLDVNDLAAEYGEYVQLGQLKLSHCGQRVAFTLDVGDGSEAFHAFTRDLRSGTTRQLSALGGVVSLEWAADGRTLLCTQPNQLGRPWRVVACDAGVAAGTAAGARVRTLFEENDERFFVELGRTKDWSYITVNCNSKAASEVHLLPTSFSLTDTVHAVGGASAAGGVPASAAPLRCVQPRVAGLEYFVEHADGQLYILSNKRSKDSYAVYRVPLAAPSLGTEHWQLLVDEGVADAAIEDMDILRSWLVLYLRRRGRQHVAALPLHGKPTDAAPGPAAVEHPNNEAAEHAPPSQHSATASATQPSHSRPHAAPSAPVPQLVTAPLPSWALSVAAGANADYDSSSLRLLLSSPVHPEAAYDWDLQTGQLMAAAPAQGLQEHRQQRHKRLRKTEERFTWQQLWATSADGTAVPVTIAHQSGLALPSPRPCLLVVYGAYGHCLPTDYQPERIPLLSRGWVVALAHVRGGGEMGRHWHAAGRAGHKGASVDDLEACMDHLMRAGYTAPRLVALEAHSAGGLTAGALLNRRAADVGAALLEAPFVDVLSAMCQPELPLTVHEYDEWGDPRQLQQLEQIHRLCPYQNVRPAPYPPTLVTCSQADLRVPYWGPLKYAARLRAAVAAAQTGGDSREAAGAGASDATCQGGPILLLADGQAGHFVHERDRFATKSQQYAFLINAIERNL